MNSQRRPHPQARPLPKSALAAAAATIGGMYYAVLRDAKQRQSDARADAVPTASAVPETAAVMLETAATPTAVPAAAAASKAMPFLGGAEQPTAANVPSFVLAATNLDAEQKLQVALCRRQAWTRAAQFGPTLALCGYSACVLTEASGLAKLPRGSKLGVPLGLFVVGMTVGAYVGMTEGKPTMNAALLAKPIEGVHVRRADRAPEEDALVAFMRSAREDKRGQ